MKNPIEDLPSGAVAGLAEVLLALGDELRKANVQVGENTYRDGKREIRQPVLFLGGASVELAISATVTASAGVKVWVVNTEAGADYQRIGKVTVHLNTGDEPLGVGM